MVSKEERGTPSSDVSYCSNFTSHLAGKRTWVRLILQGEGLCKGMRGDIRYLQKTEDSITSLILPWPLFLMCPVFEREGARGGVVMVVVVVVVVVEISVPLKCCFLRTVYRMLVINNLSQDSYFWSGLLGGNLLEVNSFILRLTVLPFPAERGEK